MMDGETLEAILDGYKASSFAEQQAIGAAHAQVSDGVDPADVLAELERKRDVVEEWTIFEREHGYAEALRRYGHELTEWWAFTGSHSDPESKGSWLLAHPIFAPMERASA